MTPRGWQRNRYWGYHLSLYQVERKGKKKRKTNSQGKKQVPLSGIVPTYCHGRHSGSRVVPHNTTLF
jgi:hypothetical protein